MRIYSKFPAEPEFESTINSSEIILDRMEYSQRVFGYVTPEITGQYRFAVSSDDNSELWISRDSSPRNVELFASVGDPDSTNGASTIPRNFRDYKNQISQIINLTAGQDYYLEALHRNQGGNGHLTIAWQTPGMKDNDFTVIDAKLLSLYLPEDFHLSEKRSEHLNCILQKHLPLIVRVVPPITPRQLKDEREEMCLKYPILDHKQVSDVLSTCPYDPTRSLHIAWYQVKLSEVYPDDKTSIYRKDGNTIIKTTEIKEVVKEYMDKLKKVKGDLYKLKRILNVVKKHDAIKGSRYLLELELSVQGKSESVLLSEYVYKFSKEYRKVHNKTTSELCYPEGMVWSKDTKIYIILPVLNYGYWVKYIIDELSKIYLNTKERNFHLVMIDFNSTDFEAEKYLQESVLRNSFTFLKKGGRFFKTEAINEGAATVKDPNSIIFLMDLHITVPPCFFDIIRKHTIKGKLSFFPELLRLSCSASDIYPQGFWEGMGYGLLGIYKKDWDSFGGEDVEKFRYRWGGEDWDLLDRVASARIEIERFKWQKLFHFPHAKKGTWYKKKNATAH
ncbi:beta-1,4-N-acetylgalactosaminyltransferase 3-like [Actinia tenebrosa]|uniref:Beta-1,4-N-acetylgalactosaminyltransferase n=1 Tax=Actinia tenebrosa TaxID=6105 RepID=A0A6P8H923_ACTTE|nr:beta-1,4-N-acetylgalactosaminyltransferase 3-like [Actinia tenebrosa]